MVMKIKDLRTKVTAEILPHRANPAFVTTAPIHLVERQSCTAKPNSQTFAPVIRIDSVRSLFAICAGNDLRIVQVDCKNAFLHSRSDFEIYVQQPEGFIDANHPELVLLLNKALYGLKQASRLWYLFLSEIIVGMGFRALETDPSIYVRGNVIIGVYVDDILACSLSISSCNSFISELAQKIELVHKGEVRSFLGISVTRNYPQHAISIGQPGYIDYLLAKYNMTNAKSASTPFEKGTKLHSATKNDTLCNLKPLSQSPLCLHKTRYRVCHLQTLQV